MGAVIWCGAGGKTIIGRSIRDSSRWKAGGRSNVVGFSFGGALVLARLVHVAFDCGGGMWWIFSEERWAESGEMGDVALYEGKV